MKSLLKFAAILLPILAQAEVTEGWCTVPTANANGPTYDFFDQANWINGEVNGLFSSEVIVPGLNGSKTMTVNLNKDWSGSFKIHSQQLYTSSKIQIQSTGGKHTVTLTDDIELGTTKQSASCVFGNMNENNQLDFDLGGKTQKIVLSGGANWGFYSRFFNGGLLLTGTTGSVTLYTKGGSDGDIKVDPGLTLGVAFTSGDKVDVSASRAANLTLNRSQLNLTGSQVNAENFFNGLLTVKSDAPGCSIVYSRASTASKSMSTTFNELSVEPGALLLFRGSKLGVDPLGDSANVYFNTQPTMIGGVIPGVIGAKTDSDTAGFSASYDQTFVTYDETKGVVPLDLTSDYASDVMGSTVNLKVPHATNVTIDQDTTVNSLYLATEATSDNFATVSAADGAKLTVSSGMVLYGYPVKSGNYKYPLISAPLDFGTTPGCIIYATGKRSQLDGPIHGSAGVTFATPIATTAAVASPGLVLGAGVKASTYTGDTYVQSCLNMGVSDFLPHGSRTGNVYVNGILQGDNFTMNGLYGKGSVGRASSGGKTVTLGDNDANGDFEGTISITDNGATLTKIGTGTQRFAGSLTLHTAINVSAGAVVLDGLVEQGAVNVAAGAKLGGSGVVKTSVAFAEGAKLLAKVEGKTLAAPLTVAAASGTAIVEADGLWKGEACVLKAAEGATLEGLTFKRGANVAALRLSDDKTELYATPKAKGFSIVVM